MKLTDQLALCILIEYEEKEEQSYCWINPLHMLIVKGSTQISLIALMFKS
jgi:hypothetical protein